MSETKFIEYRFNSVEVGDAKLWLANTQRIVIGSGRNNHLRHKTREGEVKYFPVPEKMFNAMHDDGYTTERYPDWETWAHWEDIETANAKELSSPEIDIEVDDKELHLNHFNSRVRLYGDAPEATHVEFFVGGRCLAFPPPQGLVADMFAQEYPGIYMSELALDPDTIKWMMQRKQAA
jgi:hypothetical protein